MKTPEPKKRGRPATGRDPQHQFRCPDEEWQIFVDAAKADGITAAAWIRKVAMKAAKRVKKGDE